MKFFKILLFLTILTLVLSACDLKVNINSDLEQSEVKVEENESVDTEEAEDVEPTEETKSLNYEIIETPEFMAVSVKDKDTGEFLVLDLKEACGIETMVYAEPENQPLIIFKPFDPGSDKPFSQLFILNLETKECQEMEISQELSDFGVQVLSPDQTKMALALETNEARELKLLDLVNDKAMTLVELPEGETLNGGYGAMSNHFDIKWLDTKMIQYTVFENTFANYDTNAPDEIEKVLQVRVVSVE